MRHIATFPTVYSIDAPRLSDHNGLRVFRAIIDSVDMLFKNSQKTVSFYLLQQSCSYSLNRLIRRAFPTAHLSANNQPNMCIDRYFLSHSRSVSLLDYQDTAR